MIRRPFRFSNIFKFVDALLIIAFMVTPTYVSAYIFGHGTYGNNDNVLRFVPVFIVLFILFMYFMEGFFIDRHRIHEITFSTLVAVYTTDLVCALLLLVFQNKILSFSLIAVIAVFQLFFATLWAYASNRVFCKFVNPLKTLIICDDYEISSSYITKISNFKHSFDVQGVISCNDVNLQDIVDDYASVHMIDVPSKIKIEISEYCFGQNKSVYIVPDFYEIMLNNSNKIQVDDVSVFQNKEIDISFENRLIKRAIDIVLSLVGLILSSPFMLFALIAIKMQDGGNILFCQERITRDFNKFNLYKFRTMIMNAEKVSGAVLSIENDPRITRIGRFLRKTRIDELPQLCNVLMGDMSFIGPRPEREVFINQYVQDFPHFARRLNVKAGLTGYAQVYGKYNTNPKDKLRMDLYYIVNYSLLLDIKILFLTVKTIFTLSATEGVKVGALRWYSTEQKENEFEDYNRETVNI